MLTTSHTKDAIIIPLRSKGQRVAGKMLEQNVLEVRGLQIVSVCCMKYVVGCAALGVTPKPLTGG